ncbi:MAG: BON domain-containing protein, partial [Microcoleus sp. SIO2G3]|nr:BON domain-containing protein [Microcoleus sp. SIO2G3]
LTAIRSFASDCMTRSSASELDQIDYGNCKILLEVAGYCYLAIVTQGEPPSHFLSILRQTLATIVQLYGAEIETFEGDPATIPEAIHAMLVKLGEMDWSEPAKSRSSIALIAAGVLLGAIVIPWSILSYHAKVQQRVEADTIAALAAAPELAVYRLNVTTDRHTLQLSGLVPDQRLRQRAADIAHTVAPDWTIDNQVRAVEVPADPVLAAAEVDRVARILNQAENRSIAAHYEDGKVTIAGTVSQAAEVQQVTQAFEQIPGVDSITTALQVEPLRISVRFYFGVASAEIASADRMTKLRQIKAFLDRHPQQTFQITGYSNPINGDRETQRLALQRARAVRDALIRQGISPQRLQIAGMSQYPPTHGADRPTWQSRYVEVVSAAR